VRLRLVPVRDRRVVGEFLVRVAVLERHLQRGVKRDGVREVPSIRGDAPPRLVLHHDAVERRGERPLIEVPSAVEIVFRTRSLPSKDPIHDEGLVALQEPEPVVVTLGIQ
jgi:hypothetical protein